MKIPVFVSTPTALSTEQSAVYELILDQLDRLDLEARTLGQSDYPTELPLREVVVIAKHCAGGVILGFTQLQITAGLIKPGTLQEKSVAQPFDAPTPWNNLEAGIMVALDLPLLVFREDSISGGVFDPGVTDSFIHRMPTRDMLSGQSRALNAVFLKWQARVREHYYR